MKLAFVFPGQGSQAVGMLNDMADLSVVKIPSSKPPTRSDLTCWR